MDVSTPTAAAKAQRNTLALVEAVMGGTDAMRAAGRTYLPQWPMEDAASYATRLATATLFPAYSRTVTVLGGKPFSRPLTIGEDVPARLREFSEDVDLQGSTLHVFAAGIFQAALAEGLAGILVDCPTADGARTVADERAAGIRPYLVQVRAKDLIGWRSEQQAGATVLTQLRLAESVEEPDGEFGTMPVQQIRVLEPGRWRIFRREAMAWTLFDEGPSSLGVIPFVPVYGKRLGFMQGAPPMLDLAHANVAHWQSSSDQQTILHVARVPLLFAKGLGETEIAMGANSFVTTGAKDAELMWVEHSGKAIEAGRVSLQDLEHQMRQIGAELLVIKPGNTSITQTLADNEPGRCDLQRLTEGCEASLDRVMSLMGAYIGETATGRLSLFKDFGATTLAEASATLLLDARGAGELSRETLLGEFKRRGILSPDIDVEAEIKRAKADTPVTPDVEELVRP